MQKVLCVIIAVLAHPRSEPALSTRDVQGRLYLGSEEFGTPSA